MGDRRGVILAVAALAVAFIILLSTTGPNPAIEVASSVRRAGGVCLELERWTLFGWQVVGQTHTVEDMQNSVWRPPREDPPCAEIEEREYLVRVFDRPTGRYRVCGLAEDNACVEFRVNPAVAPG